MKDDNSIVVAIDPGLTGAVVFLDASGSIIGHMPMPTYKIGKSSRVNPAALSDAIRSLQPSHAYIEKVGAMPGQGVSSMFSFGHSAGVVDGIVAGLGIPMTHITPQAWKKHSGLVGTEKDAARSRAIQLYPSERALDLKGKGQALADAIFIGRCGMGL